MATKKESAAAAKKRKGATAAPKVAEGKVLGTVSIPVFCNVNATTAFTELVVEWSCLGLSEEPDKITEVSGNAVLLDASRAPKTSEEGLHVYFNPQLPAGTYGFQFNFTYNEACEARAAKPEEETAEAA